MSDDEKRSDEPPRRAGVGYGLFKDAQEAREWVRANREKSPKSDRIHEKAGSAWILRGDRGGEPISRVRDDNDPR